MAKAAPYEPPPDPDFQTLARDGWFAWKDRKPYVVAFDCETSGIEFHDKPFCVTVAWRNPSAGITESHYFELGDPQREKAVKLILRDTPVLVGHNIKFDLQKLALVGLLDRNDITADRIEDTQALAHLDDEHRLKGLKPLAVSVLGYDDTIEVEITSGPNKGQTKLVPQEKHELDFVRRKLKLKKEDGFERLPRAVVLPYALKDAEFTRDLLDVLEPAVKKFDDLSSLYQQEKELTLVFLDMETAGLGVDVEYVQAKVKEYMGRVLASEAKISQLVGRPVLSAITPPTDEDGDAFNPNSNPQIAEFFTDAGYPRDNYDKGVLNTIDHPLAGTLLELRSDLKMLNTYLRALQRGTRDGVFHPAFRQHGTVTGRTSSGAAQAD